MRKIAFLALIMALAVFSACGSILPVSRTITR